MDTAQQTNSQPSAPQKAARRRLATTGNNDDWNEF